MVSVHPGQPEQSAPLRRRELHRSRRSPCLSLVNHAMLGSRCGRGLLVSGGTAGTENRTGSNTSSHDRFNLFE